MAQTFINERSHKYARTWDCGEKGYMDSRGSNFREEGITKEEILNADSYAWFVIHVGADNFIGGV